MTASGMREEMIRIEERKVQLEEILSKEHAPEPSLHPALADLYRERVAALHEALKDPATRDEAFGIIRTLIDGIRLISEDGELKIEQRGALAGILRLAWQNQKSPGAAASGLGSVDVHASQVKVVAGTGFEPVTFRL